jgi:hypothetical protein
MPHATAEARKQHYAAYYARNKATINAKSRRNYLKNKDRQIAVQRQRKNDNPQLEAFNQKRRAASYAGIEFTLVFEDIHWPETCPVLGIPLQYGYGLNTINAGKEGAPSFDRIDPTKGYTPGNTLIVSWRANRLKSDASLEELQKLATFYSEFIR